MIYLPFKKKPTCVHFFPAWGWDVAVVAVYNCRSSRELLRCWLYITFFFFFFFSCLKYTAKCWQVYVRQYLAADMTWIACFNKPSEKMICVSNGCRGNCECLPVGVNGHSWCGLYSRGSTWFPKGFTTRWRCLLSNGRDMDTIGRELREKHFFPLSNEERTNVVSV